jgi:hypothetical protein
MQYVSPLTTQYHCAIFNYARGLQSVNMLRDTDAVCVAIASALCVWKKEQIRPLDQGMVQAKTTTHTQKSYDRLKAEWTERIQNPLAAWLVHRLKLLKTVAEQDIHILGAVTFSEPAPPLLELTLLCSSFLKLVRREFLCLTSFLSACWKISVRILLAKLLRYRYSFCSSCILCSWHSTRQANLCAARYVQLYFAFIFLLCSCTFRRVHVYCGAVRR